MTSLKLISSVISHRQGAQLTLTEIFFSRLWFLDIDLKTGFVNFVKLVKAQRRKHVYAVTLFTTQITHP